MEPVFCLFVGRAPLRLHSLLGPGARVQAVVRSPGYNIRETFRLDILDLEC